MKTELRCPTRPCFGTSNPTRISRRCAIALECANITRHGVDCPDWSQKSHSLAFTLQSLRGRYTFHVMINAFWEPLAFELPAPTGGGTWRRCIDTALASPADIQPLNERRCILNDSIGGRRVP